MTMNAPRVVSRTGEDAAAGTYCTAIYQDRIINYFIRLPAAAKPSADRLHNACVCVLLIRITECYYRDQQRGMGVATEPRWAWPIGRGGRGYKVVADSAEASQSRYPECRPLIRGSQSGTGFTKPCALLKLDFLTSAYQKCMR